MGTHISHPSDSPFSNPHHLLIGWYPYLPIHVSILYISECYTIYVYFICLLLQLMPMYMLQASTQQPFSKRIPEISLWHSAVYKKNIVPLFFKRFYSPWFSRGNFPVFLALRTQASNSETSVAPAVVAAKRIRRTALPRRRSDKFTGGSASLGGLTPLVMWNWAESPWQNPHKWRSLKNIYIHTYRERERDVCFVHKENHLQVHHANQVARLSKVFKNLEQTSPIQSYINWSSIDHQ